MQGDRGCKGEREGKGFERDSSSCCASFCQKPNRNRDKRHTNLFGLVRFCCTISNSKKQKRERKREERDVNMKRRGKEEEMKKWKRGNSKFESTLRLLLSVTVRFTLGLGSSFKIK